MNREKEIEKMASIAGYKLHETFTETSCTDCDNYEVCKNASTPLECTAVVASRNLYNAGYGNKKQAVKEFAERLKEELNYKIQEEFGDNGDSTKYITLDIDETENTIYELVEELYGED